MNSKNPNDSRQLSPKRRLLKEKLKKIGIVVIIFFALLALLMITPKGSTPEAKDELGVPSTITPAQAIENASSEEIAILSIRGCKIYSNSATIDTRLENLRNSPESFKLVFELPNNGKAYQIFSLGPKEKRVTDIPFSGAEGNIIVYLYHDETTQGGSVPVYNLIQKTSVNLACTRGGGTGMTSRGPITPTPELSSGILVSAGLIGILIVSRKYRGN